MKYFIIYNGKEIEANDKESAEEILLKIPEDKRKNIRILSEEEYNKEFGKQQEPNPNIDEALETSLKGVFPYTSAAKDESLGVRIGAGIRDASSFPFRAGSAIVESLLTDRPFIESLGETSEESWRKGGVGGVVRSLITDPLNIFGGVGIGTGMKVVGRALPKAPTFIKNIAGGVTGGITGGAIDAATKGESIGDIATNSALGGAIGGAVPLAGGVFIGVGKKGANKVLNSLYNSGRNKVDEAARALRYGNTNMGDKANINSEELYRLYQNNPLKMGDYINKNKFELSDISKVEDENLKKKLDEIFGKEDLQKDADFEKGLDEIFGKENNRIYAVEPESAISTGVPLGQKHLQNAKSSANKDLEALNKAKIVFPEEAGLTPKEKSLYYRWKKDPYSLNEKELKQIDEINKRLEDYISLEEHNIIDSYNIGNTKNRYDFDLKDFDLSSESGKKKAQKYFDSFTSDWDFGDVNLYRTNPKNSTFEFDSSKEYSVGFRDKLEKLIKERHGFLDKTNLDAKLEQLPEGNYYGSLDKVKVGNTYSPKEKELYNNFTDDIQEVIPSIQGEVRMNQKGDEYIVGEAKKYTKEITEQLFNSLAQGKPLNAEQTNAIISSLMKKNSDELLNVFVNNLQKYKLFDDEAKKKLLTSIKNSAEYKKLARAKEAVKNEKLSMDTLFNFTQEFLEFLAKKVGLSPEKIFLYKTAGKSIVPKSIRKFYPYLQKGVNIGKSATTNVLYQGITNSSDFKNDYIPY